MVRDVIGNACILLALDDKFFKHDDLLGDETTTDGQLIHLKQYMLLILQLKRS